VKGNTTTDANGFYSISGNGYPGSRYSHSSSTISNDSIIIFGGEGYANNSNAGSSWL